MSGTLSRTQTSTSRTEPWGPQLAALQLGLADAGNLYTAGPPKFFPDPTYVPPSPQTSTALRLMERRALDNSSLTAAGRRGLAAMIAPEATAANPAFRHLEPIARGDQMAGNPELDAAIRRAAGQVRNDVNAAFASAGRTGSGYHADTLSRSLSELAGDMSYRNHAQARADQLSAASLLSQAHLAGEQQRLRALALAPQLDHADADRLAAVGAAREAQAQARLQDRMARHAHEQNAAYEHLARYLALAMGIQGPRTAVETRPVAGPSGLDLLNTASAGARLGGELFGLPGLGAGTGLLLGLL